MTERGNSSSYQVRQKPDDEGYEVWWRGPIDGYLAATHPSGGMPIEDARLFAAAGGLLAALRACRLELYWCAKQLAERGVKGHANDSVARALRDADEAIKRAAPPSQSDEDSR
jgi:hypothetical protein